MMAIEVVTVAVAKGVTSVVEVMSVPIIVVTASPTTRVEITAMSALLIKVAATSAPLVEVAAKSALLIEVTAVAALLIEVMTEAVIIATREPITVTEGVVVKLSPGAIAIESRICLSPCDPHGEHPRHHRHHESLPCPCQDQVCLSPHA